MVNSEFSALPLSDALGCFLLFQINKKRTSNISFFGEKEKNEQYLFVELLSTTEPAL